jgi:hypothetical protein
VAHGAVLDHRLESFDLSEIDLSRHPITPRNKVAKNPTLTKWMMSSYLHSLQEESGCSPT